MRLARLLWDGTDDPFYRSQNEQAGATDPFYWRLVAWTGIVLGTALVLLGTLDAGALQLMGWYALHCLAAATVASREPRLYARWRPPVCLANWLHQGWTLTQMALLSNSGALSMDSVRTPLALLLVGLWNGSLFMLCSTLRAPLLLRWNSFALPVAAAIPVWCSQAVCRLSLLQAQGAAAALQRLYRYLAWTHIVATVPGVTDPALGAAPPSALHCCWMVNTWAVVTATVLLPWARAWQRERRARRLFAWQQLQEAAGEDGPAAGPADAPAAAGDAAAAAGSEDATAESPYPTPELAIDWGASTRDAWLLAVDCRPAWAWVLDAHLLSCAAWAALLLYATARGF